MPNFPDMPLELRGKIYESLLVADCELNCPHLQCRAGKGISLCTDRLANHLSVAILRASRQTYHEGRAVLYTQNRFALTDGEFQFLAFAKLIGEHNSVLLRHLLLPFPDIDVAHYVSAAFIVRLLDLIRRQCPDIRTIGTTFSCFQPVVPWTAKQPSTSIVTQTLKQINAKFRAFPALKRVSVRIPVTYFHHPCRPLEKKNLDQMVGHGWISKTDRLAGLEAHCGESEDSGDGDDQWEGVRDCGSGDEDGNEADSDGEAELLP